MAYDLSSFDTTEFNNIVIQAYQNTDIFGTDKCIFRDSNSANDVIPVLSNKTATYVADGALAITSDTESAKTIPEFTPLKKHEYIPYSVMEKSSWSIPSEVAVSLGAAVSRIKLNTIIQMISKGGSDAGQIVDVGTAAATPTAAEAEAALVKAASILSSGQAPTYGRYAILKPSLFYALCKSQATVDQNWNSKSGGSAGTPSPMLRFADFQIMNTSEAFGATGVAGGPTAQAFTNTSGCGIAYQMNSFAMKHFNDVTTTINDSPENESILVKARLHWGAVNVQPSGGMVWLRNSSFNI